MRFTRRIQTNQLDKSQLRDIQTSYRRVGGRTGPAEPPRITLTQRSVFTMENMFGEKKCLVTATLHNPTCECTSLLSSLEHIDYSFYRKISLSPAYLRCWISMAFTFIFDYASSSLGQCSHHILFYYTDLAGALDRTQYPLLSSRSFKPIQFNHRA